MRTSSNSSANPVPGRPAGQALDGRRSTSETWWPTVKGGIERGHRLGEDHRDLAAP